MNKIWERLNCYCFMNFHRNQDITLARWYPYFISATFDFDRWTYVGRIPERITFEFKYGPSNSFHENYIVLPLDTVIINTTELCSIKDINTGQLIINSQRRIGEWDPLNQDIVDVGPYRCIDYINRPDRAVPVIPGKPYKIFVQADGTWKQQ